MKLFTERPIFEEAWKSTTFRVLMGGMGDDTAMMIAELYHRGYEPDEIVFCDTGSEFPHTYEFIEHLKRWCEEKKWSKVVVLRKFDKFNQPLSIITMVEQGNTLPAAAFGSKSCSLRFKTETADKYFNNHPKSWASWGVESKGKRLSAHTGQILRLVGINADEPQRAAKWKPEDKWIQAFPLFDWGIGEHESTLVEQVGLYYPGKSSCVCCPHLSKNELIMLRDNYPDIFERVKNIERKYQLHNMNADSTTVGLCRSKTIDQKIESSSSYCSFSEERCQECK